jgi:hypothetical protein
MLIAIQASRATVRKMHRPGFATFRPEARPATITGMQARGAAAIGALAVGAAAVGGFAIGRLSVGRLSVGRAAVGKLEVDELEIGTLHLHNRFPPGSEPGGAGD